MTRIAIAGYGNLGRGVENAVTLNDDMTLAAVFTRRDPSAVQIKTPGVPVLRLEDADKMADDIDVMVICGGSATDLPVLTPMLAGKFNVIDSFDTHADIPKHFAAVDAAASAAGKVALISAGWDPGLFSLARVYSNSVLPDGKDYTFWGRGVSQGHSDAVRRIPGVADAKQYTVPVPEAIEAVRSGAAPDLTTGQKHTRVCYVVPEEGADLEAIETAIKTMPNYFADYDTTVNFITAEELRRDHSAMPHGGFVIRTGRTSADNGHVVEFRLQLDSNPEFTSSVLIACARAVHRLSLRGETGCRTMLDIPPALLSPLSPEEQRAHLL